MKSLQKLLSFTWYCLTHRHERFWQALRNWNGVGKIEVVTMMGDEEMHDDTFYWE